MTKLSDIIKELKEESSSNKKVEILNREKNNKDLYTLFKATLDPSINYYLRGNVFDVDLFSVAHDEFVELTEEVIKEIIFHLDGRVLTGNAARAWIRGLAAGLYPEDQKLLKMMLDRDLDCKVSVGLIDKVWKDMIEEYPCLLASKFDAKTDEKIRKSYKGKFIAQLKADGGRCNAHIIDGSASFFSRNGKELLMHGVFDECLKDFEGYVIDGELLVLEGGKIANRQTGNGIFNKAVRNTISKDEAETFHFVVWDLIPIDKFKEGKDVTPYRERLSKLEKMVKDNPYNLKISLIESVEFNTLDECLKFAEDKIFDGQEGAIVKMDPLIWENKRSKDQIKIKEEKTGEFRCIGVKPHSKNPELIGSLDFASEDNKIIFNCGSGLTDEDRKKSPSDFIDFIFEVQYNSLIKSKGSDTYSLFLPVKPKIRLDKDKANTYEDLK